ncbi:MAG TPA: asparagine synthase (glutamine-hydrolyzing) [Gemmatimonadales bacterium]|nr:asparagine synthase (glutamine-hydrolyzing) [Gemmatimonadales bacterium]
MCGIAGLVRGAPSDAAAAQRMNDAIAHRGPDDEAIRGWPDHGMTLCHRRLSIIDLSPLGHNPMSNEDGSVWIVYNGEIYNFQALRRELEARGHTFRSHTDTEVVLHAYEEWGDDHVHHLRGMFAYALYDRRPRPGTRYRLLLVRDRLGIKPLFYYARPGCFAFASEIKGILACDGIDRAVDWTALYDFLTYLYIPAPKTAYAHIRKLSPGHLLALDDRGLTIREYWTLGAAATAATTPDEAVHQVARTLERAVADHLVSDVPLGVLLSGGVDSSAVTALAAGVAKPPLRTFSAGFDVAEHSELDYARLVAAHCHTRHTEQVVGRESLDRMLPHVLTLYDEPFADTSAIPTYYVTAAAGEHVKVLLSGDGGDEVFAGYGWYRSWLARGGLDRLPLGAARRLLVPLAERWPLGRRGKGVLVALSRSPLGRYAALMELFSPHRKRRLLAPARRGEFGGYDDYWHFRRHWREDLDPLARVQYLDLKTFLPDDILTKVDRASMASSVEVRPPLLDHELVEQVLALPSDWNLRAGEQKWLLKQAVADRLPAEVLHRSKKGFSAPMTQWIASSRDWADAELTRLSRLTDGAWLSPDVPALASGMVRGAEVWGLLLLQRWLAGEMGLADSAVPPPSLAGALQPSL